MLATVNGHGQHWSHDDIRTALLRRHAVEIDELFDELPRPATVTPSPRAGSTKPSARYGFAHHAGGRRIAAARPPQRTQDPIHRCRQAAQDLLAFDDPKPAPKPLVSDERAKTILAALVEPRDVLAQAGLYQATLAETGWVAVELARRQHSDPAAIARRWDDIIYQIDLLALEAQHQSAVASGQLSVADAHQLFRVAPTHRVTAAVILTQIAD